MNTLTEKLTNWNLFVALILIATTVYISSKDLIQGFSGTFPSQVIYIPANVFRGYKGGTLVENGLKLSIGKIHTFLNLRFKSYAIVSNSMF